MERKKNIILIGFMGCGKTSVGIKLSYRLRMPVEDTDKYIEQKEGRSISSIFVEDGESFFRALETKTLEEFRDKSYTRIISVGGGTPVNPVNRELLRQCGTVVYLRVRPETVYERLKNDTSRPLLQCEKPLDRIHSLMTERREAYEETADIIIDVDDKSMEEVLEELTAQLPGKGKLKDRKAEEGKKRRRKENRGR